MSAGCDRDLHTIVEDLVGRGVYKGCAKALTDAQVAQVQKWVADGVPKAEVARRLGLGRTALYAYFQT